MSRRSGAAALALAMLLFAGSEASAQGLFDLFDGDARSGRRAAAPRPSRDIPRAAERRRAEPRAKKREGARVAKPGGEAAKPAATAAEAPPAPYEAQMTRLAEVLGALAFLRDLCGAGDGDDWRGKMSALLDAEAPNGARREKFVAAFNRGFRGYELTYRVCTANAEAAIGRYLSEADRISRDIAYRYGSP